MLLPQFSKDGLRTATGHFCQLAKFPDPASIGLRLTWKTGIGHIGYEKCGRGGADLLNGKGTNTLICFVIESAAVREVSVQGLLGRGEA